MTLLQHNRRRLDVRVEGRRPYKGHFDFGVRVQNVSHRQVVVDEVGLVDMGKGERDRRQLSAPVGERLEPGASRTFRTRIGTPEELLAMGDDLRPYAVTADGHEVLGVAVDAAELRAAVEDGRRPKSLVEQLANIPAAFGPQ